LELARAMIIAKDLPIFLWDEAVAHAALPTKLSIDMSLK
jgi:hypothetical protein